MWEHIMKQAKPKSIDLGSLQDTYNSTKKQLVTDARALTKAQDSFDRSKQAFQGASEALKQASRAVLD